ncbi:MAG: hypothetical protein ABUS48_00835 [Pseudomonadota bacterium]
MARTHEHNHSNTGVPGLTFSWKRAVGLSRLETDISRKTGIPFTRQGRQRKIGEFVTHMFGSLIMLALVGLAVEVALHPSWIAAIQSMMPKH